MSKTIKVYRNQTDPRVRVLNLPGPTGPTGPTGPESAEVCYPVGSIFLCNPGVEPSELFDFGTWAKITEGAPEFADAWERTE